MDRVAAVPGVVRGLVGAAGSVLVIASMMLASVLGASTSYFSAFGPVAAAMSVGGVALLGSGLLELTVRPWWSGGPLMVAAAVLWFAPTWIAWASGPPIIRTLGMLAIMFLPVVLAHLVLGYPDGDARGRSTRAVLGIAYVVVGVAAAVVALFYDPFRDVRCWANCNDNVLLLAPVPRLADAALILGACLAAGLLWFAAARSAAQFARDREWGPRIAVIAGAGTLAVGATIDAIVVAGHGDPSPPAPWSTSARVAAAAGVMLIALAPAWRLSIARRRRLAIDEVVRSSAAGGSSALEQALRTAVGDPELTLAYWLPASQRFVDSSGRAIPEPDGAPDAPAKLMRSGHPVAVIGHRIAATELERELGPAVRVALENEGLRAEVDAQLAELRVARGRIVASGDAHRRELERALHDGAQQQLTVLALRLRTLADAARAADDPCAETLEQGVDLARTALEELRRIAHGIHPTVLEHEGLPAALASFAVTAPIPVELDGISERRCAPAIEVTAYQFVVEAVDDAHRRGATHVVVRVGTDNVTLVMSVEDDGAEQMAVSDRIADRVGAVGGTAASLRGRARVELPCES